MHICLRRLKKESNVNIIENKIESQVKFWSLLGPFVILLSITILLFKVSSHWYLPLSALVGIPVCLKWKIKGLAATLTFLLTSVVLAYSGWSLEERYWQIGMSLAMACSLVILTLSLEEAEGLVGQLQRESQSRLDNFLRLDGQVRHSEQEWGVEKELLQGHVQTLTKELTRLQEDKQTYQKLVLLAKDELVTLHVQHEKLLEDLNHKKQHISQLKEKAEEAEVTIQGFVNQDSEQQLKQVSVQLMRTEQILHQVTEQLLTTQENYVKIKQEEANQRQLNENLMCQLNELKNEQMTLSSSLSNLQKEYEEICQIEAQHGCDLEHKSGLLRECQEKSLQKEQELTGCLESLRHEYTALTSTLSHLQSDYKRLCQLEKQYGLDLEQKSGLLREWQEKYAQKEEELNNEVETLSAEQVALSSALSQLQQDYKALCQLEKQRAYDLEHQSALLHEWQEKYAKKESALLKAEGQNQQWEIECKRIQQKAELCQSQLQEQSQLIADQHLEFEQTRVKEEGWEKALKQHQDQFKQLNHYCQQLEEHQHVLKQDLEQARQKCFQFEQEINRATDALKSYQEDVNRQAGQLAQKSQALLAVEEKEVEWKARIEHYQQEINALKQTHQQAEEQRQSLEKELEEMKKLGVETPTHKSSQRAEAMYGQLKEQFKEKSEVLDATRKELFYTQEQLLALQQEWKEKSTFEWSEGERQLQEQLSQSTQDLEEANFEYKEELEMLHTLIANLLKQIYRREN